MQVSAGVGVDIVRIGQLEGMLANGGSSFQQLCWTVDELVHCDGSAPRLAARWAAKEAVMKALGRGIGDIDPTDIEIAGSDGHKPAVRLRGSAWALAEELQVDLAVSMSHEDDLAIAVVVATPRSSGGCARCHQEGGDHGTE